MIEIPKNDLYVRTKSECLDALYFRMEGALVHATEFLMTGICKTFLVMVVDRCHISQSPKPKPA
jgi:hypothetical protein